MACFSVQFQCFARRDNIQGLVVESNHRVQDAAELRASDVMARKKRCYGVVTEIIWEPRN
jgi:hypothetical protein